jgi:hypothetical protein
MPSRPLSHSGRETGHQPLAAERDASTKLLKNGEPVGIRTRDLLIKSQLLYRLSYGLAAPFENIRGAGEWVNRR